MIKLDLLNFKEIFFSLKKDNCSEVIISRLEKERDCTKTLNHA